MTERKQALDIWTFRYEQKEDNCFNPYTPKIDQFQISQKRLTPFLLITSFTTVTAIFLSPMLSSWKMPSTWSTEKLRYRPFIVPFPEIALCNFNCKRVDLPLLNGGTSLCKCV